MKKTIGQLSTIDRGAIRLSIFCSLILALPIAVQAMPFAEKVIDQALKSGAIAGMGDRGRDVVVSLKKWIGPYQKISRSHKEGEYTATFARGSLPITFYVSGGVGVGCPVTKVPLSKAPSNIQETFGKCPNLKA